MANRSHGAKEMTMRTLILGVSIVSATPFLLTNGAYAQGHGSEDFQSGQPCFSVQDCNSRGPHQDQGREAAQTSTGFAAGVIGVGAAVTGDPVMGGVAAGLGAFSAGAPAVSPDGSVGDANAAAAGEGAAPGDN
jgi:hypothetical protein